MREGFDSQMCELLSDWQLGGKKSQCQVTENTCRDKVKVKLNYFHIHYIYISIGTLSKVPSHLASAHSLHPSHQMQYIG